MEHQLTVIKGGIPLPAGKKGRTFISGFATDTRLMGVVGLELTWEVFRNSRIEKLHQIFYLDCEEFGLESYTEGYDDSEEVITERNRLYGALGGCMVPVSEQDARFLIQYHSHINERYGQPLPDGREKYAFLMKPEQALSKEDFRSLFDRICGCNYQANFVINHFMMRCVSGDAPGADWLLETPDYDQHDEILPSDLPDMSDCPIFLRDWRGTLCRNCIEPIGIPEDHTFFCEALIEYRNHYQVMTAALKLSDDETRVIYARRNNDFKITSIEAAMLINRSEFITIYDIPEDSEALYEVFGMFVSAFTETNYENGRLYIDFNDNNDHAGESIYLINNDIRAMYFLSDGGQILIMGYSFETVRDAEFRMFMSILPCMPTLHMRYEFREPVLYEFIKSSFTDFDEFMGYIGGEPEDEL